MSEGNIHFQFFKTLFYLHQVKQITFTATLALFTENMPRFTNA
ncbi:hypothetical protein [Mucilaginibacter frigoritolerans]|nr:hypothetical protein [Mucilaginibacter frigoritolerans]